MSVFTNKHVIVALLVAPLLAVMAYFAVDYKVSEKPHAAVEGNVYALVAKSNCRYASGKCTLENGDVNIDIVANSQEGEGVVYTLTADLPLEGVRIGFNQAQQSSTLTTVIALNDQLTHWQARLPNQPDDQAIQIVVQINGALYYGETTTIFSQMETGFSQASMN